MTTTATTHPVPMSAINQITVGDNGWHNVTEEYTAVYTGRPEFWTGLSAGDAVTVHRTTYFRPDGSVSAVSVYVSNGGAWLFVNDESDLRDLRPIGATR